MRQFLTERRLLFILALLIAVIMWLYVRFTH